MHYPRRSACYPGVAAGVTPPRSPRPGGPDPTNPPPDATESRVRFLVRLVAAIAFCTR